MGENQSWPRQWFRKHLFKICGGNVAFKKQFSAQEIKCRVLYRSTAFHAWIKSDLLGSHSPSWSFDPKDHFLWAIGLLTLIQLCLNDWLKDFKYSSITLCNISIFRLDPSVKVPHGATLARWSEAAGVSSKKVEQGLGWRGRWAVIQSALWLGHVAFVWVMFWILHLMRNFQHTGEVLCLPGCHWCWIFKFTRS